MAGAQESAVVPSPALVIDVLQRADDLRKKGAWAESAALYEEASSLQAAPDPDLYLKLARCYQRTGDQKRMFDSLSRVADTSDNLLHWSSAAGLLDRLPVDVRPPSKRQVRLAITASHATGDLGRMLRLAALRHGIDVIPHEGAYCQYEQDILDPDSSLFGFEPQFVLIAAHEGALHLPPYSEAPEKEVETELDRWRTLWHRIRTRSGADVLQHNFVPRPEAALGHLSARLAGSRYSMIQALNSRLARDGDALTIDCDRIASEVGRRSWFDERYWHLAKQAVAPPYVPLLARHTISVLAGSLGLSRKCLVVDLDNTLWGGVIGEDGLSGIRLGAGPEGEAFVAFQRYILELRAKGVVIAVASKNNEADAKEVFERHPDMALKLDDIAIFAVNWDDKALNLRRIASELGLGLDSLVFVDDNPLECELVRRELPEVDVIALPTDPSHYVRRLSDYLGFETATLTREDLRRADEYKTRVRIESLAATATNMEAFYQSLDMRGLIAPFDEMNLPRIAQLVSKTNQFNLTTRRRTAQELRDLMSDPGCVALYLKLKDRFADHGLVCVAIAHKTSDLLDIDTFLISCRVIGRTAEASLLEHLCADAANLGCTRLRGTYVPSPKNDLVSGMYSRFNFEDMTRAGGEGTVWEYDLTTKGPINNPFIRRWTEDDDGST
jgi:FkbH-like protein